MKYLYSIICVFLFSDCTPVGLLNTNNSLSLNYSQYTTIDPLATNFFPLNKNEMLDDTEKNLNESIIKYGEMKTDNSEKPIYQPQEQTEVTKFGNKELHNEGLFKRNVSNINLKQINNLNKKNFDEEKDEKITAAHQSKKERDGEYGLFEVNDEQKNQQKDIEKNSNIDLTINSRSKRSNNGFNKSDDDKNKKFKLNSKNNDKTEENNLDDGSGDGRIIPNKQTNDHNFTTNNTINQENEIGNVKNNTKEIEKTNYTNSVTIENPSSTISTDYNNTDTIVPTTIRNIISTDSINSEKNHSQENNSTNDMQNGVLNEKNSGNKMQYFNIYAFVTFFFINLYNMI